MTKLRIFTLNCWAIPIPFVSKNRRQRIRAITEHLRANNYDVVCLQELWSIDDYDYIKDNVEDALPYSHYFYSGVSGSGVCIFSRYPIVETFFHQWSLNGKIHKIMHGDWYGGKGVGLCAIQFHHFKLCVYSAHLHAKYNNRSDEYKAHRLLQAYDTAKFIKLTSAGFDLALFAGDLNIEPADLEYKLLNAYGLKDICPKDKSHFGTHETEENSYTSSKLAKDEPNGKRIDYIFYKTHTLDVQIDSFYLPLLKRIPGRDFSYSDHEAVLAELEITEKDKAAGDFALPDTSENCVLVECNVVIEHALNSLPKSRRYFCSLALVGLVCLLLLLTVININKTVEMILIILCTLMVGFCLFMGLMWNKIETNALLTCKKSMEICARHFSQAYNALIMK